MNTHRGFKMSNIVVFWWQHLQHFYIISYFYCIICICLTQRILKRTSQQHFSATHVILIFAVVQMVFVKHHNVKSPQPCLDMHVACPRCSIFRTGRHHMGAVFHSQCKPCHITDHKILDICNECFMKCSSFHYVSRKKCFSYGWLDLLHVVEFNAAISEYGESGFLK